jgi:sporulation protein YlmC with PRC-barrel domain
MKQRNLWTSLGLIGALAASPAVFTDPAESPAESGPDLPRTSETMRMEAEKFVGQTVTDASGGRLGSVSDIVIGESDYRLYAVVDLAAETPEPTLGQTVFNADGSAFGSVADFVMGKDDRQPYAVVAVAGMEHGPGDTDVVVSDARPPGGAETRGSSDEVADAESAPAGQDDPAQAAGAGSRVEVADTGPAPEDRRQDDPAQAAGSDEVADAGSAPADRRQDHPAQAAGRPAGQQAPDRTMTPSWLGIALAAIGVAALGTWLVARHRG